jgi:hypothetical protein
VGSTIKSAKTENRSPHTVKAPAGTASESARTEIKRSHTHTDDDTVEANEAPLGSASESGRKEAESRRGKTKENGHARPREPGVRSCG